MVADGGGGARIEGAAEEDEGGIDKFGGMEEIRCKQGLAFRKAVGGGRGV